MSVTNRRCASGPSNVAWVHGSMRHCRSAEERRKRNTPTSALPAANQTAAVAEANATNSATSSGPTMNIVSISTESSEYAVESDASSFTRWRRYVRMQTVIGGKLAPANAAQAKIATLGARSETAASRAARDAGKS